MRKSIRDELSYLTFVIIKLNLLVVYSGEMPGKSANIINQVNEATYKRRTKLLKLVHSK